jgi:flagellin FlaB
MRTFRFRRRRDDGAAIGVGSLIIFIALILVAAIAAAVIIATVHSFQDRAEQRASEASATTCGSFKVAVIEGHRDSPGGSGILNGTIDYLRIYISTWDCPVDMNRTRVEVRTGAPPSAGGSYSILSLSWLYSLTICGPTGQLNQPQQLALADSRSYAAEEVPGGVDNSGWDPWVGCPPTRAPTFFLVPGNVLVLTIDLRPTIGIAGQLPPSTTCTIKIIPNSGIEYIDAFTTPSGYGTSAIVDLTNA